jgi:ABC-type bacteriocin/lantibiotic exporter with double-glycine peptidase domain
MGGFIFLPFAKVNTLVAYNRIVKLSETTKKITERLKEYPVGLTAQKRINNFLQLPSKNNIQKNILISESIKDIVFKNVSFEYIKDEPVLKEFCQNFCVGKVNRLTGENGSGKSTIISLIMGIYQFQKGEILINQKYKLNEINLRK